MHVHTSQYGRKDKDTSFFREKHGGSEQYGSMATNEPVYESMEHDVNESVPAISHESVPEPGKEHKPKLKTKRTRRGFGINGKKTTKFTIFGNNANLGNPSCILIQESKLRFQGTFKISGYQIFEKIRMGQGGGLLTAVNDNLSPMLISEGSEDEEILVIQVVVGKYKTRIINAYGPQETDNQDKILSFWQEFEKQIINAKDEGCLVLVEMDANAKLGAGIIKDDPHFISENGRLLWDIIQRNNLICLNAHEKCEGSITRYRKTISGEESSILDYIIVCEQLAAFFSEC